MASTPKISDRLRRRAIGLLLAVAVAGHAPLAAQTPGGSGAVTALSPDVSPFVQTAAEALAQDAGEYARRNDVTLAEAARRLRAQEESVAETDRLQDRYRGRLAGISIEHRPDYRIVVLLTGSERVADRTIFAGEMRVPVVLRTGAAAMRDEVVVAIRANQATIRARLRGAPGLGLDPRTGEMVVVVNERAAAFEDMDLLDAELEELTGVPVRVRVLGSESADFAVDGGARVEGVDPRDGRRYVCTTGFVVTDGARTGVVTAAHCPDALTYYDTGGDRTPLEFVGQWGVGFQDVQVHVSSRAQRPLFYADAAARRARVLSGARARGRGRAPGRATPSATGASRRATAALRSS